MNRYLQDPSARRNFKAWSRWGALLGGGALAIYGISRRSKSGAALAAAGGVLVYGIAPELTTRHHSRRIRFHR
jgi:uncharacterized membrane protein